MSEKILVEKAEGIGLLTLTIQSAVTGARMLGSGQIRPGHEEDEGCQQGEARNAGPISLS